MNIRQWTLVICKGDKYYITTIKELSKYNSEYEGFIVKESINIVLLLVKAY